MTSGYLKVILLYIVIFRKLKITKGLTGSKKDGR